MAKDKYELMIVEKDSALSQKICDGLNILGFDCTGFSNAEEALKQTRRANPDLFIVNAELSDMTGLQFLAALKGEFGEALAPVLMLSDLAGEVLINEAFEAGVADFILKPVPVALLRAKIMTAIVADREKRRLAAKPDSKFEIGPYEIERELGQGAMGIVYLARHRDSGQRVALKSLVYDSEDIDTILRFRREIDLLVRLKSPNVVKFLEAGRAGDIFYYAMEYIEGDTLEQKVLREGPLNPILLMKYCAQICQTLSYIHSMNLVHRDIKPSNVIISPEKGAVLVGFGLSKIKYDRQITSTNLLVGTPHYMAPEYIQGQDQTPASDMFSLALVCMSVLRGTSVFDSKNSYTIMNMISHGEFMSPDELEQELRLKLPPAFRRALESMLIMEVKERLQSAEELQSILEDLLAESIEH